MYACSGSSCPSVRPSRLPRCQGLTCHSLAANNFLFIAGVRRSVAKKLLPYLNVVGEHHLATASLLTPPSSPFDQMRGDLRTEHLHRRALARSYDTFMEQQLLETSTPIPQSPGYVTLDACDDLGDDTLHRPLPASWQPIFVSTQFPEARWRPAHEDEERLDVVFFDFIQPDILAALNYLQDEREYSMDDVRLYIETGLSANTLMQEYATREWN